ncbi:hypothetical protein HN51_022604 [Arachis hypogaea]
MKEKGFLYTVFLISEISPTRIALFEDSVDDWIQIAYPRLSIDWGDTFRKPVLNPFEVEITLGVIPGWWEKKKNVLVAKLQEGCEDGCVSCQKSGDSSCECSCGEDENGNGKSDFGGEYPLDYYSQDGGEWNSSYVKKSSRPGVYGNGGEGSEDVGKREGVHEESLGELKGNALGVGGKNAPNAFVDLEVVVVRENGDGSVEGRVVEDGIGDLVLHKLLRR